VGSDRWGLTRGQFLKAFAGVAAGLVVDQETAAALAGRGAAPSRLAQAEPFHTFLSRPDLRPPRAAVRAGRARSYDSPDGLWFIGAYTNGFRAEGTQQLQWGPLILSAHGRPVWFKPTREGWYAMNFRTQIYLGRPVLTWWEGPVPGKGSARQGEAVVMDASYREIARVRAGNGHQVDVHEFLLTPEGTALITASPSIVTADLTSVGGQRRGQIFEAVIQEIDIGTGQVLLEWRSLDHVPVSESYVPAGEGVHDYMHVNSIDVTPDGNLLVSGRHTWALYKLERSTGRVIWRLGGKKSDFHMGQGAQFAWQHDGRQPDEETVTVFDDGAAFFVGNQHFRTTHSESRGLTLSVDQAARTVSVGHSYRHRPPLLTGGFGNMQTLPDGDVVVGWGNYPDFSHYTAEGALVQEVDLPVVYASYRAYRQPWKGTPGERPAVTVTRGSDGRRTTVHVSWNGSTECSSWRVRAGADPTRLHPVATRRRTDFETAIDVPVRSGYVEVTALDSAGRALARSDAVKL
jgi:hypothetical protein